MTDNFEQSDVIDEQSVLIDTIDKPTVTYPRPRESVGFLISETFEEGINERIPCDVDTFVKTFVKNSAKGTMLSIYREKGQRNIVISDWCKVNNSYKRNVVSNIEIISPVKSVITKTVSTERYYYKEQTLVIESYHQTPNIIYGDTFRIENIMEITPIDENESQYAVYYSVHFFNKDNFFLKDTIQMQIIKNFKKDMKVMYNKYCQYLQNRTNGTVIMKSIQRCTSETNLTSLFKKPINQSNKTSNTICKTSINDGNSTNDSTHITNCIDSRCEEYIKEDRDKTILPFSRADTFKQIIDVKLPIDYITYFRKFVDDRSKSNQIRLRRMNGEDNIVIDDWSKNEMNDRKRTILSSVPILLREGRGMLETREIQKFYLTDQELIIFSQKRHCSVNDYYTLESKITVSHLTSTESKLSIQASVHYEYRPNNMKNETEIISRYERECEISLKNLFDLIDEDSDRLNIEIKSTQNNISNKWSIDKICIVIQDFVCISILLLLISIFCY